MMIIIRKVSSASRRERARRRSNSWFSLAQDKGGPGKVGFQNNRLLPYTDLYFCNDIMVCVYKSCVIQDNNILFRKPPILGPPLSLPD